LLTQTQTETLFHTYSQFASVPNIPPKPTEDERQTEAKLQEILEKVINNHYQNTDLPLTLISGIPWLRS
jgi:Golgi SNAP receptor complex protein 1